MIFGIDTYQGDDSPYTLQKIDFGKMKSSGAEFVIIKAGQNFTPDALYSVTL